MAAGLLWNAWDGLRGALQQQIAQQAAQCGQNIYISGTTTSTNTSSIGAAYMAMSPSKPAPKNHLEWLDKRVDEMRVRL